VLKKNVFNILFILIVSFTLTSDLFFHSGNNLTFDGRIHVSTMAQFWQALSDGEFPVRWSNNFANFGLPLPLIAHQIPAYLGALMIGLGFSPVMSYNLVLFTGVLMGNLLFYLYLKRHFSNELALTGLVVYAFFAYRIVNIYTRGALPEVFSSGIFPITLIAIDYLFESKFVRGMILLTLGIAGLALTHPMMLIVYSLVIIGYFGFNLLKSNKYQTAIYFLASFIIGILISAYYLFPLLIEIKYFYQGQGKNEFDQTKFLGFENFLDSGWYYFYSHPGPRGHFISVGFIESAIFAFGLIILVYALISKRKNKNKVNQKLFFWTAISAGSVVLLLPISKWIYNYLPGFNQLQFPWRFLNAYQVAIPLILLYGIKSIPKLNKNWILLSLIGLVLILRMPQLYGKNYTNFDEKYFNFVKSNLHTQNLNTIWSDNSENYPTKNTQTEIISGQGVFNSQNLKNASRKYDLSVKSDLRIVDNTFYFPGWKVYIDGTEVPVEFQDTNFRGLITYNVPQGNHQVVVKYENTKIRSIGAALSLVGIVLFLLIPASFYRLEKCFSQQKSN